MYLSPLNPYVHHSNSTVMGLVIYRRHACTHRCIAARLKWQLQRLQQSAPRKLTRLGRQCHGCRDGRHRPCRYTRRELWRCIWSRFWRGPLCTGSRTLAGMAGQLGVLVGFQERAPEADRGCVSAGRAQSNSARRSIQPLHQPGGVHANKHGDWH